MAFYDLTLPLRSEQPPWPGDLPYSREPMSEIRKGDSNNTSKIVVGTHFGTHLDAPYHFVEDGTKLDELPLEPMIGPALVHETFSPQQIAVGDLPDLNGVERIIFKTSNTEFIADTVFHTDYVSVGLDAAKKLSQAGVKLIGIDYFSVEAFKAPGHPVHHELCGRGIVLVEGLDLRAVKPGWYELIVLPLKLQGSDGSPCRAVLRDL